MPKRTDIKRILVIGSGPIVIGQACEFDYSGAQACKVLKYTPAGSLVDFNQVLDEMWVVAQEEMNFQTEAANLERFHALNQDVVFVTSPILYRAYTTTNVLVMERIDGMGIRAGSSMLVMT